MSIQSMTGYGKAEIEGDKYTLSVELKTVNNRFKDLRFKMGSVFNSKEMGLKKKLESKFSRGSFDIYVNYKKSEMQSQEIELDFEKIKKYIEQMKEVSQETGTELNFQPTEFLRSDFIKEDGDKEEELLQMIDGVFDQALSSLEASRVEEGAKLVSKLQDHIEIYKKHYLKVKELKDGYQDKVREKLRKRMSEENSDLGVDEPRFLQEVIYYLEKLDIDEEVNRITIHLEKLNSLLQSEGEVGRQIDFLVQELNRETNTIGSKSGDSLISESVVQMKVQLEKFREQALNLQ